MVKAEQLADLECSSDAAARAAEVLRARFAEVVALRGAALSSEDVEAVHDMRVATRRLRSALRDFAPILRKRPLGRVKKDLKNLADVLGAARDEDVALAALEKLRAKAATDLLAAGIEKLIEERRENRRAAQLDLTKTLDAVSLDELQARFETAVDAAARRKKLARTVEFSDAGRDVVLKSLKEFGRLSESLYAPGEVKKLHRLRIAGKRLRYALELFTVCWGAPIAPFAEGIAEMQGALGEVHDADLWIEDFSRRLKSEDEFSPANLWLLSRFVKSRTKNYRRALEIWGDWQTDRFVERLRALIAAVD